MQAFEDDLLEREKNAEIIEQSSAFVSNTTPQGRADDVSANAFVEQQGKKKAALDEFMKEQSDRLASLNSPLPFLPRTPKVQSNPTASKTKSPRTILCSASSIPGLSRRQQEGSVRSGFSGSLNPFIFAGS
jgi:hypothetical protein